MRRKIIAIIGTLLVMALTVGTPVSEQAYAAEPDLGIAPCTQYIKDCSASISISGKTVTIRGNVEGAFSVTKCKVTVYLQKKNSNGTWTDMSDPIVGKEKSGNYASESGSRSVSSGTYRAKAVGQVYYGSWESVTSFSSQVVV